MFAEDLLRGARPPPTTGAADEGGEGVPLGISPATNKNSRLTSRGGGTFQRDDSSGSVKAISSGLPPPCTFWQIVSRVNDGDRFNPARGSDDGNRP